MLHDCAAGPAESDAAKATATLQARFALLGWALDATPDGTFLAGRWGRTRELEGFDAAERFLAMLEGRHG